MRQRRCSVCGAGYDADTCPHATQQLDLPGGSEEGVLADQRRKLHNPSGVNSLWLMLAKSMLAANDSSRLVRVLHRLAAWLGPRMEGRFLSVVYRTRPEPAPTPPPLPRLAELLETADDFHLCDTVFIKIGERYAHWIDASRYQPVERTIMLTWQAMGLIDNSGFECLFSDNFDGDEGYRLTVAAFEDIGCDRAVTAFREALAAFKESGYPTDPEERMQIYTAVDEATREEINKRFWSAGWEKEIERKLAEYIRAHASDLTHLDP